MAATSEEQDSHLLKRVENIETILRDQSKAVERSITASSGMANSLDLFMQHMRMRRNWLSWNSLVAYILFVVLLGGGFLALYKVRANSLIAQRDSALKNIETLRAQIGSIENASQIKTQKDKMATELQKAQHNADYEAVLSKVAELRQFGLSPLETMAAEAIEQQTREHVGKNYIEKGDEARKHGDWQTAVRWYTKARQTAKQPPELWLRLGISRLEAGDPKGAISELRQALSSQELSKPQRINAAFTLAIASEKSGSKQEAAQLYKEFATRFPQDPKANIAWKRHARLRKKSPSATVPTNSKPPRPNLPKKTMSGEKGDKQGK